MSETMTGWPKCSACHGDGWTYMGCGRHRVLCRCMFCADEHCDERATFFGVLPYCDQHEADAVVFRTHKPFTDDGVNYCGYDGRDGCGEVWPCSTVRELRARELTYTVTRKQIVMTRTEMPGATDRHMIYFHHRGDDETEPTCFAFEPFAWDEMGRPSEITVTVERGDLLNGGDDV